MLTVLCVPAEIEASRISSGRQVSKSLLNLSMLKFVLSCMHMTDMIIDVMLIVVVCRLATQFEVQYSFKYAVQ